MDTIKCNLDHYPSMSEQYGRWIETVKDACADMYISTYELRPIPNNSRMIPFKKVIVYRIRLMCLLMGESQV